MLVRALVIFDDYLEGVTREVGDVFEVSEERHEEILTNGGEWVEVVKEEALLEEEPPKTAGKKGKGKA